MVSKKLLMSAASVVTLSLGVLGVTAASASASMPRPSAASAPTHGLTTTLKHLAGTVHAQSAPGPGALVTTNYDLEGCVYEIAAENVSLKNAPDGTDVAPTAKGDFAISAPRTVSGKDNAWEFVLDVTNGHSGWIAKPFMTFEFCTSPTSETP
jgi:hypothetical protein